MTNEACGHAPVLGYDHGTSRGDAWTAAAGLFHEVGLA